MPCLIGCLALVAPRLALFLVWLFSDLLGNAYDGWLWPVLGFLFMPVTTLAYAWSVRETGSVEGGYVVLMVVAVLLDFGLIGGGSRSTSRRRE
ncbi:MAG: hypothetical protein KDC38_00255 [Planctomycetes bacterium]|nr:hypothetical protein [Planctomycetota bacterium]